MCIDFVVIFCVTINGIYAQHPNVYFGKDCFMKGFMTPEIGMKGSLLLKLLPPAFCPLHSTCISQHAICGWLCPTWQQPQLFNFLIKFGLSRETPVTTSLGTQIGRCGWTEEEVESSQQSGGMKTLQDDLRWVDIGIMKLCILGGNQIIKEAAHVAGSFDGNCS